MSLLAGAERVANMDQLGHYRFGTFVEATTEHPLWQPIQDFRLDFSQFLRELERRHPTLVSFAYDEPINELRISTTIPKRSKSVVIVEGQIMGIHHYADRQFPPSGLEITTEDFSVSDEGNPSIDNNRLNFLKGGRDGLFNLRISVDINVAKEPSIAEWRGLVLYEGNNRGRLVDSAAGLFNQFIIDHRVPIWRLPF